MSPSIFSHNSHLRPSANPQSTPAPPSSFSRSFAVKSSIRKIPSVFFNKSEATEKATARAKFPIYMDESQTNAATQKSSRSIFSSPKRNNVALCTANIAPTVNKEKSKPRTKTRKALADILGWGNHSSNAAAQPQTPPYIPYTSAAALKKPTSYPAPAATAPPVPPKEANMPAVLKKRPSRPLSGKSSQSALSGYSSLHVPQETPQSRARPSMGADPFSRRDEGAEVVDVVIRHGGASSVTSSAVSDRRTSAESTKASSTKTQVNDGASVRDETLRPRAVPPSAYTPVVVDSNPFCTLFQHGHAALGPSPNILLDLPACSNSLGVTHNTFGTLSSNSSPQSNNIREVEIKTLKKEKTKSKVWGIFGGGKKVKEKEKKVDSPDPKSKPALDIRTVEAQSAFDQASINTGLISTSYTRPVQTTIRSDRIESASTRMQNVTKGTCSRPAPPALHIQKPSIDDTRTIGGNSAGSKTVSPVFPFDRSGTPSSPAKVPCSGEHGGVWETIAGTAPERSSADGPRTNIVAQLAPKGVPKRKSLTGLFGVSLKRSFDRLRPSVSKSSLRSDEGAVRLPPTTLNSEALKTLSEEVESVDPMTKSGCVSADPVNLAVVKKPKSHADLRRVASATDKLSALVFCFEFSPTATPSDNGSLDAPPSLASLDGSPTPIRRIRSAVLTSKKSASSPLRAGKNISPLKLALHRSQVANKPTPVTKLTKGHTHSTSLVRKGMRNVFAPPTPPSRINFADDAPQSCSTAKVRDSISPSALQSSGHSLTSDVAIELRELIGEGASVSSAKVAPNRDLSAPAFEAESHTSNGRISPVPPQLTLDLIQGNPSRTSVFGGFLEPISTDRYSFDFTGEYAALDQGYQRASFMEALAQVQSTRPLALPSLPPTPVNVSALRNENDDSLQHVSAMLGEGCDSEDEEDDEEADEQLEVEIATAQVHLTPRPAPFQGQPAFQAHVAQLCSPPKPTSEQHLERPAQPFTFVSMPAAIDMPTRATAQAATPANARRGHRRGESGSMSSMGSLIEDGIPTDFTNYFEIHFAAHLNNQSHARNHSLDSTTSYRRHHRRNSSIISVQSISEDLAQVLNDMGPPISMHNPRRSSYISRHRRSSESFGRSDWAAHRRNASVESSSSAISFARIGRPGLGERMFQLDGGVQLSSITASPPDEAGSEAPTPVAARQQQTHSRDKSFDSLLEWSGESYDSLLNSSAERSKPDSLLDESTRIDCVFGGSPLNADERKFMLKGLRPISTASAATSSTLAASDDDTFRKYGNDMSPVPRGQAACLEADGEDNTSIRYMGDSTVSGGQVLNASMSRPPKHRRKPANLVFNPSSVRSHPETPALSSPSASEASSRLSLETKFSDVPSVFTASRIRPGHVRQKSSAVIGAKLQSTIKEERSSNTLRANRKAQAGATPKSQRPKARAVDWDDDTPIETVKSWVAWKREADDEYRRTRTYWVDDEETNDAVADFKLPMSYDEIARFLAKSAEAYKPLEQLPIGRRTVPHRRKSSLSDTRHFLSPYGVPLPRPPTQAQEREQRPKMSLPTKFERTRSSTSSHLTVSDGSGTPASATSTPSRAPLSALFAQFVREVPPASAPVLAPTPLTPLALPSFDTYKAEEGVTGSPRNDAYSAAGRQRVNSKARREALGWGRRRNSDGPTKVEQMARVFERVQADDGDLQGLPRDLQEGLRAKSRLTKPTPLRTTNENTVPKAPPFPIVAPAAKTRIPQPSAKRAAESTKDKENRPFTVGQPRTGLRVKPSRQGRSTGFSGIETIGQQTKMLRPKASGPSKAMLNPPQSRTLRA